ncbi:CHD5-like protein-domain-containing protein [Stachybotrys elegans]|uniref:CHD5-like protein-domain-containing protein n=1 Tax=Stachybotrys elegans TaxID=80388 RepID=A0A8K0WRL5_9HYPO|nr:CHD5-like protein-domain-containing protein [Stachybotrys elegans]
MAALLVTVLFVEAAVRLINAVGATSINNLLWTAYNHLPVSTSKAASQQRKLQAEYLKVRRDLNATSSQDEFAKWAKLRRQHDKLLEQLESTKKGMESSRASFDQYLNAMRFLLTRAPQFLIPFWYAKEPMFWLPHGWFPYYAEWIISFPRAPLGSVSIASWQLACAGLMEMLADLVTGILGLVLSAGRTKEAPVKAAEATGGKGEKKEL